MRREATGEELQAELLKALAHPFRLQLLAELAREEECVCHLTALFGKPQPYVSQQLAELKDAALLRDRREGQRIYYSLSDDRLLTLLSVARELTGSPDRPLEPRQPVPGCPCPKCS